jgi:hypothetical protein
MTEKPDTNHAVRTIYEGLGWIVTLIDWLSYDYMIPWRNDIMKWRMELKKRYNWLKD